MKPAVRQDEPGCRTIALKAGIMASRDGAALWDPLSDAHLSAEQLAGTACGSAERYYFEDPRGRPGAWNIELVNSCTLACRHCYQNARRCEPWDRPGGPHVAGWRRMADALLALDPEEVSLSGGEVILADVAVPLLEYLRERRAGLRLRLLLSGVAIAQRRTFRSLLARLREWDVLAKAPLYGGLCHFHDWVTRSPGSWADAVAAVRALRDAGVRTIVSYEIMGRTADGAAETVEFLRGLVGSDFMVATIIFPARGGARRAFGADPVSAEQLDRLLADRAFAALPVEYLSFQPQCAAGCRFPTVTASGDVLPCAVVESHCGNVYEDVSALARADRVGPTGASRAACAACEAAPICKACPAFFKESGPSAAYCALACQTARHVVRRINEAVTQGYKFVHPEAAAAWERMGDRAAGEAVQQIREG